MGKRLHDRRLRAAIPLIGAGALLAMPPAIDARPRGDAGEAAPATTSPDGEPLPILSDIPRFAFTNIDGRRIDEASLRGHVWIADFIFTRCVTMCPITTAKMSVLRRALRSAGLCFVSFSVDPAYDTPAVLRAYAGRWSADPRWLLLTTTPAKITAFATAMNMPFEHTAMPLEPILHTSLFFLMDQQGHVRGQYGSLDDASVRRLMTDVARLEPGAVRPREHAGPSAGHERPSRQRGRALFQALGCAACHADARTGPPLAGLAGGRVSLQDGTTAVADAAYLKQSLLAPSEKVVSGYNPLMPAYGDYLGPADVDDLVAYLQSMPAPPR